MYCFDCSDKALDVYFEPRKVTLADDFNIKTEEAFIKFFLYQLDL